MIIYKIWLCLLKKLADSLRLLFLSNLLTSIWYLSETFVEKTRSNY